MPPILGAGPTAFGLAGGLAIRSLFFAPTDLPMYAVNVSTLLVALGALAGARALRGWKDGGLFVNRLRHPA